MRYIVLDSESDGLWKEATKVHVVAWTEDGITFNHTHDYSEMRELLCTTDTKFVAHNAIRHDLPLFNKILGTKLTYRNFVDTLALSWYLNFERNKHGLETFGVDFDIPKPVVTDWVGLTPEDYAFRCVEDIKINWKLWVDLSRKLELLYGKPATP